MVKNWLILAIQILILLRIKISVLSLIDVKDMIENVNSNFVVHRWTRCTGQWIDYKRWIRVERKESYWGCNNKATVHFALFWESFICLFIGACDSGDAWITYSHNRSHELQNNQLMLAMIYSRELKRCYTRKGFIPLRVAGHQHFTALLMLALYSFLQVEK